MMRLPCFSQPTAQHQYAQWPQLKESYSIPKLDHLGERLATIVNGNVQVWTVADDGQPNQIVWNSLDRLPNSYPLNFEWLGGQLLVSTVETPIAINQDFLENLFSDEGQTDFDNLLRSRGNTWVVDIQRNEQNVIIDTAYTTLVAENRNGKRFAGLFPSHLKDQFNQVTFYEFNGKNKASLIGQATTEFERTPLLISWDGETTGIFALGHIKPKGIDDNAEDLVFLKLDGTQKSVIPENVHVPRPVRFAVPAGEISGIYTLISHFGQYQSISLIDPEGVRSKVPEVESRKSLRNVLKAPAIVSVSQNGRFILYQESGESEQGLVSDKPLDIWAVDIQTKRRRKLASVGEVFSTSKWSMGRLVLGTWVGGDDGFMQYGILRFPEGILPADDPKLNIIVSSASWEMRAAVTITKDTIATGNR